MKKVLLGTTALVAATLVAAPGAQASEKIKLELGGFMAQVVGWSQQKDTYTAALAGARDYQGFDQKSASEIHVKGETKLDNGITVGMRVEFEVDSPNGDNGASGAREFDETFMYVSSATLGKLELGSTKGPAWSMGHRAPNTTLVGINAGDVQPNVWLSVPTAVNARTNNAATGADDVSDVNRVNYISPRFMGFGVGVSYVPDAGYTNDASGGTTANGPVSNGGNGRYNSYTIAYDDTLFGVKVGADIHAAHREGSSASAANRSLGNADVDYYGGGLNLGYAGFVVGGSFERMLNASAKSSTSAALVSVDGHKWDAGVSYATGPYKVSFTYTRGENQGLVQTVGNDKYKEWTLGGNYNLGAGVDFNAALFYGKYVDETTAAANNNDGYGLQAGILLSF